MTVFALKRIRFGERDVQIVTQNENGPCPLLAIINVLVLRGEISFHNDSKNVSLESLLERVGDRLLHHLPQTDDPEVAASVHQDLADVLALLPSLQHGMDVNVRFDGVKSFEYTPAMACFDLLKITLRHAWVVENGPNEETDFLASLSYNQLVELVFQYREAVNQPTPERESAMTPRAEDSRDTTAHEVDARTQAVDNAESGKETADLADNIAASSSQNEATLVPDEAQFSTMQICETAFQDMGAAGVQHNSAAPEPLGAAADTANPSGVPAETGMPEIDLGGCAPDGEPEYTNVQTTAMQESAESAEGGATGSPLHRKSFEESATDEPVAEGESAWEEIDAAEAAQEDAPQKISMPEPTVNDADVTQGVGEQDATSGESSAVELSSAECAVPPPADHVAAGANEEATGDDGSPDPQAQKQSMPAEDLSSEFLMRGAVAESFLAENPHQVTEFGFAQLHRNMHDGELSILFHNNHFSTILYRDHALYMLVTDQGYLHESDAVWQVMTGPVSCEFVDSNFRLFQWHKRRPSDPVDAPPPDPHRVDLEARDQEFARRLQEEYWQEAEAAEARARDEERRAPEQPRVQQNAQQPTAPQVYTRDDVYGPRPVNRAAPQRHANDPRARYEAQGNSLRELAREREARYQQEQLQQARAAAARPAAAGGINQAMQDPEFVAMQRRMYEEAQRRHIAERRRSKPKSDKSSCSVM